jgi:outer membrane murein-binding lipoprotein Lpp
MGMVVAALALAGCSAKVLSPTPADQLRRQNAELAAKVDSLERQLSEARTALAADSSRLKAGGGEAEPAEGAGLALSPEAIEATPHLAGIAIAGSSHTDRPLSGEGCVARIYVMPVDGMGRFLQVVGTASVTLYWSPPGCEAEVLSCHEFGPLAVRAAYRSGFGGTHYTLEWPVAPVGASAGASGSSSSAGSEGSSWTCGSAVEVKVEFTDARSGRVFTARRALAAIAIGTGDRH